MRHAFRSACLAGVGAVLLHAPATASEDGAELWLNPSASFELDGDTNVELETAQRFRSAADGRADTYFARLWLNRKLGKAITLSGAAERRINDGDDDETRLMQQVSIRHGVLHTRLRLEQRFVDRSGRMGLRLRPRLGVSVPLEGKGRWSLQANGELFLTARSTSPGGDDGLTGLRTQAGATYQLSERLSLSATYLRQQNVRKGAPDRVGHAPLLGLELSF